MLFILEIIEFLRNPKEKIIGILKEESGKEIFIFPAAYGITLWSQLLKASRAGDTLGFFSLFSGLLLVGSIAGLFFYFAYPYVLTWVSKMFVKTGNYKDMQKIFAWSLTPFLIGALLTLVELILGGSKLYSSAVFNANDFGFIAIILSFILFASYFITIYFIVVFTKTLSSSLKIQWWKALIIIFTSTAVIMLPTFLLRF